MRNQRFTSSRCCVLNEAANLRFEVHWRPLIETALDGVVNLMAHFLQFCRIFKFTRKIDFDVGISDDNQSAVDCFSREATAVQGFSLDSLPKCLNASQDHQSKPFGLLVATARFDRRAQKSTLKADGPCKSQSDHLQLSLNSIHNHCGATRGQPRRGLIAKEHRRVCSKLYANREPFALLHREYLLESP